MKVPVKTLNVIYPSVGYLPVIFAVAPLTPPVIVSPITNLPAIGSNELLTTEEIPAKFGYFSSANSFKLEEFFGQSL